MIIYNATLSVRFPPINMSKTFQKFAMLKNAVLG